VRVSLDIKFDAVKILMIEKFARAVEAATILPVKRRATKIKAIVHVSMIFNYSISCGTEVMHFGVAALFGQGQVIRSIFLVIKATVAPSANERHVWLRLPVLAKAEERDAGAGDVGSGNQVSENLLCVLGDHDWLVDLADFTKVQLPEL
jgi:hypothetical protein